MALQPNGPAPYTTAASVTTVLDAWRDRGLGVPVTQDVLARAGVPESLARRTFQSLVALDLLSADGKPTEQFEDFKATRGDPEYRARLQEWVRGLYADVLQYVDPSAESYERVTEAFRTYEPAGQRRAMASLLLGLWKYAGLPVPSPGSPGDANGRRPARPPRVAAKPSRPRSKQQATEPPRGGPLPRGLPPGLIGLLQQIPSDGRGWTEETRDSFLLAFAAVLNFTVPLRPVGVEDVTDEDGIGGPDPYEDDP